MRVPIPSTIGVVHVVTLMTALGWAKDQKGDQGQLGFQRVEGRLARPSWKNPNAELNTGRTAMTEASTYGRGGVGIVRKLEDNFVGHITGDLRRNLSPLQWRMAYRNLAFL